MTDPKREIMDILYRFEGSESVLDVGCGVPCAFLEWEQTRYPDLRYTGIDIKRGEDWYTYEPGDYDIIIANDLFPNVDQRLELFLDKYLPHCKGMRLSLTYFDEPKWYVAKRVDGDEILTMAAWSLTRIYTVLNTHGHGYENMKFSGTFPNGRKVLLVWLKGGL